jgi:hypothetical protein
VSRDMSLTTDLLTRCNDMRARTAESGTRSRCATAGLVRLDKQTQRRRSVSQSTDDIRLVVTRHVHAS